MPVKYVYHILFITYMFRPLLRPTSGHLHESTDKVQQTAILYK